MVYDYPPFDHTVGTRCPPSSTPALCHPWQGSASHLLQLEQCAPPGRQTPYEASSLLPCKCTDRRSLMGAGASYLHHLAIQASMRKLSRGLFAWALICPCHAGYPDIRTQTIEVANSGYGSSLMCSTNTSATPRLQLLLFFQCMFILALHSSTMAAPRLRSIAPG